MSESLLDSESLPYSAPKQEAIMGHLILDAAFFAQARTKVRQSWWRYGRLAQIWKNLEGFVNEHDRHPRSAAELKDFGPWVRQSMEDLKAANEAVDRCLYRAAHEYSLEVLKAELDVWMQANIIESSMTKVQASYTTVTKTGKKSDMDEVRTILRLMLRDLDEAAFLGNGTADMSNLGQALLDERIDYDTALTFGCPAVDNLLLPDGPDGRSLVRGDHTVVLSPTNQGKCLHPRTPVMMADGTVKKAKDVRTGDQLMGPDGLPRNVLSTTSGFGPLYRVSPKTGGRPWICNDVHVLSLVRSFDAEPEQLTLQLNMGECDIPREGDIVNIPLDQYLAKGRDWQRGMKLWRASLSFQTKELPVPPYALGVWLGGGSGCDISAAETGLGTGKLKSIPHEYLTSSREQRLELLAGLIDSSGHYSGDHTPAYEVPQKSRKLADGIAYLARSLGFEVTVTKARKWALAGTLDARYKLLICGPLSMVPVKSEKKRALDSRKNPTTSKFRVESIGDGEYYGFTLDGDHLFLLGDFTVTHNTTSLITVSSANLLQGKDVLFVFHEGRINDIRTKFLKSLLGTGYQETLTRLSTPEAALIQQTVNEHLVVLPIVQGGISVEEAMGHIERAQDEWYAKTGRHFDLIVDDYPGKLMTTYAKGGQMAMRHIQEIAYNRFTALAQATGRECHVLTAIQTNREGSKVNKGRSKEGGHRLIDTEDVAETFGAIQTATNVLTLNRDPVSAANNVVTWGIAKSRSGETGHAILTRSFYHMARTHWNDPKDSTWYRGSVSMADKVQELLENYSGSEVKGWRDD